MPYTDSKQLNRIRPWACILSGFAILWCAWAQASDVIDIRLYPDASVSGRSIYLRQIAGIQAQDTDKARKLGDIRIEAAPLPGHTVLVHKRTVERRLRRYGVDTTQYRIASGGPVKVKRLATRIAPDKIREAVKSFILKNAPWKDDQMRIRKIRFNHPVQVPPGIVTLAVKAPKHTDWIGGIPFGVKVLVDGENAAKVTVPVNIEVWSDVAVVTKPLGKYQPIGPDNIRIEKMDLARVPNNAVLDPQQVLGCRANRNIAANSILRSDQVERPPIVRRGDIVQVVAESPILKIAVKGIVQQNGGVDQRVKVVNLRSKKLIYAQVLDERTVKVEF